MRVATLNLWNKSGPWLERMALVRQRLDSLGADIVGLQEVLELDSGGKVQNQCAEICGDYHWCYAPGHNMKGPWVQAGTQLRFGNALLSRFPIKSHDTYVLPGFEDSDQKRCLLHAVLEAPLGRIDVFVTHLNWKLDEGWIRELQVKEIVRLIRAHGDSSDFPPLLMGDLNALPGSDEIRYLGGQTRLGEERSTYFADAWNYVPHKGEGFTFNARINEFAATYGEAPRRLDYIFIEGSLKKQRGVPSDVGLAFHEPDPDKGIYCSDHFGVYADLNDH